MMLKVLISAFDLESSVNEFDFASFGRTIIDDDHIAEDALIELVLFFDFLDFGSCQFEGEVKVKTCPAFVDFVTELTAAHGGGGFHFSAQGFDQFAEFLAEGCAFVIRLADVQDEYRFVLFQNKTSCV